MIRIISTFTPDQTGFMRGRYIGDNIRNILEIIETVKEEDLSSDQYAGVPHR